MIGKRLQEAGAPGEILIGRRTHRLVAHAVVAEPATLDVKGRSAALAAFRLQSVDAQASPLPRRDDARLVGRERERLLLTEKWERVVSERTCSLFTVVGVAGVGKSRLTAEFLSSLGDVTVVRGRCLPYGEGITYRPVIEVVEQLPRVELDPPAAAALRSLLGSEAPSASADEIGWAFRKLSAPPPLNARSSSSSKTSSGPRNASSSSSSSSPCSRAMRRFCCSASPVPSCSMPRRGGRWRFGSSPCRRRRPSG